MKLKVARWGNSLAVRLSKELAERAGLREGLEVEIEVDGDVLMIRRRRARYSLDELLAQVTDENLHEEADWGVPEGKEIW